MSDYYINVLTKIFLH